jgi:hypothetical protein
MAAFGHAWLREVIETQLCSTVKTAEIGQIQQFLDVGFRPILLKNSFAQLLY